MHPNVIDSWNLLDVDTQNQHSRLMFKKQIRFNISVPPPYFALGTRKYYIFHCQLRNLASNLNQHKYYVNICMYLVLLCIFGNILQKIKISMLVFNAIKFTCLLLDFNVSGEDIKVDMIQNYFRYIPKHFLKL
jgi:hypothetical protein